MNLADSIIPRQVNAGSFVAAWTHAALKQRIRDARVVLPICSLGTPAEELEALGSFVLPPLYHEALSGDLQERLVTEIQRCFPFYEGSRARAAWSGRLAVVELPRNPPPPPRARPRVVAFSVDTAVEQHGPHLPLATDTLQSYAILERLAANFAGFVVAAPVDYGQLTWGLPFGLSIDVTAPLLTRYVTGYANALAEWLAPDAVYVVDVHGSVQHRAAVEAGLKASRCALHAFRWLYEPLTSFGAGRGDVHAGGIETAVIRAISSGLVDEDWWPKRVVDLAAGQMTPAVADELSSDVTEFVRHVEARSLNGIVGDVQNFFALDGAALLDRMLAVARDDVEQLLARAEPRAQG